MILIAVYNHHKFSTQDGGNQRCSTSGASVEVEQGEAGQNTPSTSEEARQLAKCTSACEAADPVGSISGIDKVN
jgi:hypothetical protein